MSLAKDLELLKDRELLKFILQQFLDYAMGALLNSRDKFAEDEDLRKLYKKLNECITLTEEL